MGGPLILKSESANMIALKDAASMIEKAEANTDRNTKKGFGAVRKPGAFITRAFPNSYDAEDYALGADSIRCLLRMLLEHA